LEPLSGVFFAQGMLITSCAGGQVKFWSRTIKNDHIEAINTIHATSTSPTIPIVITSPTPEKK